MINIKSILNKDLYFITRIIGIYPEHFKKILIGAKIEIDDSGKKIEAFFDKESVCLFEHVVGLIIGGTRNSNQYPLKKAKLVYIPKENVELFLKHLEEKTEIIEECSENLEFSLESASTQEIGGVNKEIISIEDLTVSITKKLFNELYKKEFSEEEKETAIKQYIKEMFK